MAQDIKLMKLINQKIKLCVRQALEQLYEEDLLA